MKTKKKILILGKSNKFIKLVKKIYPESKFIIVSWREINSYDLSLKFLKKYIKVVFLCGYDYSSQLYNYERYYQANVSGPLKFLKKIIKKSCKIIYINTLSENKISTYSRYEFAKIELALELKKNYPNFYNVNIPTIINKNDRPLIIGSFFQKIFFNLLIKQKIIKTINERQLFLFLKKLEKNQITKPLKPMLLSFRRTLFIDRLLRMINV